LGQRTCWSEQSNKRGERKGRCKDVPSKHVVLPLPDTQKIGGSISLFLDFGALKFVKHGELQFTAAR
jgi:hypothetical protein